MTLQNGLQTAEKVYLWTDEGHFCAATGEMLLKAPKAVKCQHPPFAVSISTGSGFPHEILNEIAGAAPPTIETLLWVVADALRAFAAKGHIGRALIAAYDDGPHLFSVSTLPDEGQPPFVPVELLHTVCGAKLPEYHAAVAEGLTPRNMAKVIDAQLASPFALQGPLSAVGERLWFGGGVVQIEVSRTGVKERVIRMVDGGNVAPDRKSRAAPAIASAGASGGVSQMRRSGSRRLA